MKIKNCVAALVVAASVAGAANASELVTFTAGQPAKAAEVNANFKLLQDKLNELGSFQNLTDAQLNSLRASLGTAAIKRATANCRTNPAALREALSYSTNDLASIAIITVQGNCHVPNVSLYDFNLVLQGDTSTGASLIPAADGVWNLLGGFNGGLFISNMTLNPPNTSTGALFSRVSQGDLRNVVINGGRIGVSVGSNAQVYLGDVQIKDTVHHGISINGGG
jgi:hypothetical protein